MVDQSSVAGIGACARDGTFKWFTLLGSVAEGVIMGYSYLSIMELLSIGLSVCLFVRTFVNPSINLSTCLIIQEKVLLDLSYAGSWTFRLNYCYINKY